MVHLKKPKTLKRFTRCPTPSHSRATIVQMMYVSSRRRWLLPYPNRGVYKVSGTSSQSVAESSHLGRQENEVERMTHVGMILAILLLLTIGGCERQGPPQKPIGSATNKHVEEASTPPSR